jgi:hypothetical protein
MAALDSLTLTDPVFAEQTTVKWIDTPVGYLGNKVGDKNSRFAL